MSENDRPLSTMSGDELISYLNVLAIRQSEYSKLKQKFIEELIPIENARNEKRAAIRVVDDKKSQTKIEIANCKYAIKSAAEGLS